MQKSYHDSAQVSSSAGYLSLCREEPFRLFFPLGLACGIVGLALWPLFFAEMLPIYPGIMHARLMIEGFMGAFIIGFLGTAGPRLLSAPRFTGAEVATLAGLHLAAVTAHLIAAPALGDAFFLALLVAFAGILARRCVARAELPPPNFVLVGCGLLCGVIGAAIVVGSSLFDFPPQLYAFGALALSQGFILLPVLGVGVFLFPRFLGVPFGAELNGLRDFSPWWRRKALIAAVTALVVIASFALEAAGFLRTASLVRFIAATAYVGTQMPSVLRPGRAPFLGQCIRTSVWIMLAGLLWTAFLPGYRVAGLHLVFVGGFMLTVLTVATRVMFGHSGQLHLCRSGRPLPFLLVSGVLLLVGLVARIGADFMPSAASRGVHLVYASLLCIGAAVVWGLRLTPRVFVPDAES